MKKISLFPQLFNILPIIKAVVFLYAPTLNVGKKTFTMAKVILLIKIINRKIINFSKLKYFL